MFADGRPRPDHQVVSNEGENDVDITKGPWQDPTLQKALYHKGIDITCAHRIGNGHFSRVITSRIVANKVQIAIKVVDLKNVPKHYKTSFLPREVELWKRLNHPNLVRLLAHYQYENYVLLAMEYGSGGDVLRYVQENGALPDPKASLWMFQIMNGLAHMHSLHIAHRDLKLENIVIIRDSLVKIADFGFSTMAVNRLSTTFCGSRSYVAPEILLGRPYDPFKADVWSLGVVAFIMVTNRMPFDENIPNEQLLLMQRARTYTYPSRLEISSACRLSIDNMLTFSSSLRPTVAACFYEPWPSMHSMYYK